MCVWLCCCVCVCGVCLSDCECVRLVVCTCVIACVCMCIFVCVYMCVCVRVCHLQIFIVLHSVEQVGDDSPEVQTVKDIEEGERARETVSETHR